jgi:broad specificity phosphatase PhoE
MRATFIRHGQSTGNAGMPCHDLATIELTEKGWNQARRVATDWTEAPSLIVTSPFLRTQQTAAPTIERFPDVPVRIWPIEEFTYLQPSRWNGTRSSERMPHLERYWTDANPTYCDGDGAESFGALLRRAEAALARLAALPPPASPMCSATGSSSRRCAPSSWNPIWTTEAKCCASGGRARHPRSATPSWCISRYRMQVGAINHRP